MKKKKRSAVLLPFFILLLLTSIVLIWMNARLAEKNRTEEEKQYADGSSMINNSGKNAADEQPRSAEAESTSTAVPEAGLTEEVSQSEFITPEPIPTPEPEYVSTIQELALRGRIPDPNGWHETDDASELSVFLQREDVQKLLKGRSTVWNENIVRFPNTTLKWYFDETILCIVWQEIEAQAVGTFSEVFIQDGSQLRRKISGDELWSFAFKTTTQFAQETNAVLAFGGDFYYHGRACGIGFYQRALYRFEPDSCDTCWITADGDLLFSYRGQIKEQEEAERFAIENDVLFTLVFGPVLIDNGQDVTPELYPWGEVTDTYARAALGLLERHHYLTMNINCWQPGTEYYNLATLRQEADAMLKRGCQKAYALDGGQTATTVFGGKLVNPVQFGEEKEISDIIYFASALGGERKEIA